MQWFLLVKCLFKVFVPVVVVVVFVVVVVVVVGGGGGGGGGGSGGGGGDYSFSNFSTVFSDAL